MVEEPEVLVPEVRIRGPSEHPAEIAVLIARDDRPSALALDLMVEMLVELALCRSILTALPAVGYRRASAEPNSQRNKQ